MIPHRIIIAIQAPAGADLTPVLPYLERTGTVEFRQPSLLYLDAGYEPDVKRLRRKLLLLRATVQTMLQVPIRIGAATTKVVCLIAARQSPRGGMTIVVPGEEQSFLEQTVIDLLPGIGRRTATYLRNRGVTTIGKFGQLPQTAAVRLFGLSGLVLREYSRGADPRDLIPTDGRGKQPVAIGRQSLFSMFRSRSYSTLGAGTN